MKSNNTIPEFSLFGGPLNKLGVRMGLVRKGDNSIRLGIALGLLSWCILLLLSLLQGTSQRFFSLTILAGHIRFLVAIPLFFVCETYVFPRIAEFSRYLVNSGLVEEAEQPKLATAINSINRMKDFWLVEGILFFTMFLVPFFGGGNLEGNSSSTDWIIQQAGGHLTWVNVFYLWFCLPLFRFLLLRWFWHLGLWCYFLYCIQQLNLRLMPAHPDGAGGLGELEVVQEHFTPLALAFSSILSASAAEEIITGTLPFETLYYLIPLALLLNLVFFVGPLLLFSHKLWICRINGLSEYMAMATHYTDAFDQKWLRDKKVTGESQLGTADIQSLADLTNIVKVIHEMRTIIISKRLILAFTVSVFLPFVPFVFMKFQFNELMLKLFQILAGV